MVTVGRFSRIDFCEKSTIRGREPCNRVASTFVLISAVTWGKGGLLFLVLFAFLLFFWIVLSAVRGGNKEDIILVVSIVVFC